MKKEIKIFLTAIMFFTRIPCPDDMEYSQDILDETTRYYPVVGWIVGGVAALVFYAAHLVLPVSISIFLSMVSTIMLTGAFHEDGFADVCDGCGGGWEKSQVLEIMKDSRIGTYGAIGLIAILSCKYLALSEISVELIPAVLIAGHGLSRAVSTIFRFTHQYVREGDDSRAKPMVQKLSLKNLFLVLIFGLLPLFLLKNFFAFLLIIPVLAAEFLFTRYISKRIGGYTGDCLGAAQQLCEVTFYLSCVILWKFI